ncbi:hypothetical protein BH09VER1_BH09VER1_17530 [soil metagenome]
MESPLRSCRSLAKLILALVLAGFVEESRADIVADFKEGDSASAADGYPGDTGGGWTGGWKIKAENATFTAVAVLDKEPLSATVKTYLNAKGEGPAPEGDAVGRAGAISRHYEQDSEGVDLLQPVKYEFAFRAESWEPTDRYLIFDAPKTQFSSGQNLTWQISAFAGMWRLMDGPGNGGKQAEINTKIPIVAGTVYTFTVVADPQSRKWMATISDGQKTETFKDINFRTDKSVLGGNFHVGYSDGDSKGPVTFGYSFGCIKISQAQALGAGTISSKTDVAKATRVKAPLEIQIEEAIARGDKQMKLPLGMVRLDDTLRITGARDFELLGEGTTLVMSVPKEILSIDQCANFRIKGVTIDYDPLPFTQGTVTAVSKDNMEFEFEIHEGYPDLKPDMQAGVARHFFDKDTRLWKAGTNSFAAPKLEIVSPRKGRAIFSKYSGPQAGVVVGDLICFDRRMLGLGSGIAIHGCPGTVEFEDVKVHASPALAFVGRACEGQVVLRRVKIERGPRPANATQDRLLSTNADGVNFAYCRTGPLVENCDFSFMGDDSVNLHGPFLEIIRVISPGEILAGKPGGANDFYEHIKKGDAVEIVGGTAFEKLGEVPFQSISKAVVGDNVTAEETKDLKDPMGKPNAFTVFRLTFGKGADFTKAGQWLNFPALNCPNFTIKDSYFHDHRARGLRIMASNGVITNNRFERIARAAVQLGPELSHWREAGWVENVTISNNTLKDIGFSKDFTGANCYAPGAISVCAATDAKSPPYPQGNENITIDSNTIDGCMVSGIHAYATNKLIVRNNTISRVNLADCSVAGSAYQLSARHAIELDGVGNPIVQDNKLSPEIP